MPAVPVDRDTIFLMHAVTDSARALAALDEVVRLAGIVDRSEPNMERRENSSVFVQIRLALHYAASVCRVFWPTDRAARARGRRLRQLATLPDEGHPLDDRRLRNHIEHLDERLDRWTRESPRPFLQLEWVIHDNWPDEAKPSIIEATAVVYDAQVNRVHILGEAFALDELRAAVRDVNVHAGEALRRAV